MCLTAIKGDYPALAGIGRRRAEFAMPKLTWEAGCGSAGRRASELMAWLIVCQTNEFEISPSP